MLTKDVLGVIWSQILGWIPAYMNKDDGQKFVEECAPEYLKWREVSDVPDKWRDIFKNAAKEMKKAGRWRPEFDELNWD